MTGFAAALAAPMIWSVALAASPARTDSAVSAEQIRATSDAPAAPLLSGTPAGPESEPIRPLLGLDDLLMAGLGLTPAGLHASHPTRSDPIEPGADTSAMRNGLRGESASILDGADAATAALPTPAALYARRPAMLDSRAPTPAAKPVLLQPAVLLAAAASPFDDEPADGDDSRSRRGVSSYGTTSPRLSNSAAVSATSTGEASPADGRQSSGDARRVRTRAGAQAAARVSMHNVATESAASTRSRLGFDRDSAWSIDRIGSGIPGALGSATDLSRFSRGLRIESVELFSGYSSNGLSNENNFSPGASQLGSDGQAGVRTTIAYHRSGRHSDFHLSYSPTHTQRFRVNEWNSTDHIASLGFSRQIGARWDLSIQGNGGLVGLEQAWLVAPTIHRVENPPTTIEELMERAAAGEFTDDEVASLLTGAPVVDDPGGVGLGLSRVARASASVRTSYAYSPRTSFNFGGSGSTYRVVGFNGPERVNFFRRSDYATADVGLDRKINMRTSIGVQGSARSIRSNFYHSRSNQITLSYTKELSSRWRYSINGGAGIVNNDASFLQTAENPLTERTFAASTWVLGGSVNYLGRANRFTFAADRQSGDVLGAGATATVSGRLSWQWMRPTSSWGVSAGASYFRNVVDQNIRSIESGLVNTGLIHRLSASTLIRTDYMVGRYNSSYRGLVPNITVHRVQATLIWIPSEGRR